MADRGRLAGRAQQPDHDYVVVGAGLLGLAAARALARRGREVIVLEQASPGHEGAGSKGSCRIFRLGYPDPAYVEAALRARELWHALENDSSRPILFPTPQLSFGTGLTAVQEAMALAGAPGELLPAAEAAARFPAVAADGPVLLEPDSCVIAADTALEALAAGVPEIRTGVRVSALADDGRHVTLRTSQGRLSARVAVVCAGPWTAELLAGAWDGWRAASAPTLEQVAYLGPAETSPSGPAMPIFICHGSQSPYGLPVPGSALYKTGIHPSGPPVRPDDQRQAADPVLAARLAAAARRHLPGLDSRPVRVERCVYDTTPDEDFIVDRVGNVVIGSGTSGHGFKFGPLLGEWLAGLAIDGQPGPRVQPGPRGAASWSRLPDDRFALARFSRAGAGSGAG